MALRLTRPADAPKTIPHGRSGSTRAHASLLAGDLKGYRELFAQAATGREPAPALPVAAAHAARAGLAAAQYLVEDRAAAVPHGRTQRTRAARGRASPVPSSLNYLGVALYELGSLEPRRRSTPAAGSTTPCRTEGASSRRRLRRRAGGNPAAPEHPRAPVRAPGADRESQRRRCQRRQRPVQGLRLEFLCMIAASRRGGEPPRCSALPASAVDEMMIIVDTGSTDRTVEIAESFGARVLHHE